MAQGDPNVEENLSIQAEDAFFTTRGLFRGPLPAMTAPPSQTVHLQELLQGTRKQTLQIRDMIAGLALPTWKIVFSEGKSQSASGGASGCRGCVRVEVLGAVHVQMSTWELSHAKLCHAFCD